MSDAAKPNGPERIAATIEGTALYEEPLFIDDRELARRIGIDPSELDRIVAALDRLGFAFPQRDRWFGNKRYWPAVVAVFAKYQTACANGELA
jgi:DNA-binding IclR family transcriptional regulator